MTQLRLTVLVAFASFLLIGCEAEFDPTAPKGSTPYIMCVLDAKDSAQYVRVQRSYISHENAYNFSKNSDSLYYNPEDLIVSLTRFDTLDGSIMDDQIIFYPTDEIHKDTGQFASEGHYLFKSTEQIHPEFEYELSIVFPAEDKRVTARMTPLGSWNFDHAFSDESRKTRYSWYTPERIDYFLPLTMNRHQQVSRFLYRELSSRDTVNKYVEYFHDYNSFTSGEDDFEGLDFLGDEFLYRFISDEIDPDPEIRRVALGWDFMVHIADTTLLTYQTAGDPKGTFMHTPEYSNFRNGGVGLFASRYKFTIFGKLLKSEEIDSISMGYITKDLNFADSKGQFHGGGQ